MHVPVEVLEEVTGVGPLEDAEGVNERAVVLKLLGALDGVVGNLSFEAVAVVGLAVGKENDDFLGVRAGAMTPRSIKYTIRKSQTKVGSSRTLGLKLIDVRLQSVRIVREVRNDLRVVFAASVEVVPNAILVTVLVRIVRELHQ